MTDAFLDDLARCGLDLAAPLDPAAYDALLADAPTLRPLAQLAGAGRAGLILGNSRALWPHVLRWWRAHGGDDPVDAYVSATIQRLTAAHGLAPSVHLDTDAGERRVDLCRAAAAAGLAERGPAHLAVHAELGPWIALRAVLVFEGEPPPPPPPATRCAACAAPCVPAMERALTLGAPTNAAELTERWRAWLAVRDACPVGREHRYGEHQLRYHYTKDRGALRDDDATEP